MTLISNPSDKRQYLKQEDKVIQSFYSTLPFVSCIYNKARSGHLYREMDATSWLKTSWKFENPKSDQEYHYDDLTLSS